MLLSRSEKEIRLCVYIRSHSILYVWQKMVDNFDFYGFVFELGDGAVQRCAQHRVAQVYHFQVFSFTQETCRNQSHKTCSNCPNLEFRNGKFLTTTIVPLTKGLVTQRTVISRTMDSFWISCGLTWSAPALYSKGIVLLYPTWYFKY